MEENEINHQLRNVENYLGSYAIDELNEIKVSNYPSFIVLNLDTRNGIGMHWIALAIYFNEIYVCDSLGGIIPDGSMPQPLIDFLHIFSSSRKLYVTKQLQHTSSGTCGLYCITFIKQMSKFNNFGEFLRLFTDNFYQNDIIIKFLNKMQNV